MKKIMLKGSLFICLLLFSIVTTTNQASATPTLPIVSYGLVSSTGTELSGYGIDSITLVSTGRYEIAFDDFNYYYADYITVATALSSGFYNITTGSMSGQRLIIYIKDEDGNPVNAMFSFIVYEPGD